MSETRVTTPHWPSTVRLWRESAALNSWGCTSKRTSSGPHAPVKLPVLWRTPPIPPTVSSSSYHQEDGSGASEPAPPDCSTAFFPQAVRALNSNPPAPLWNPIQTPYLLKHGPSHHPPPTPQTTPNPTTSQKKTVWDSSMQFEMCYTQVSRTVQTTYSNTISSIHMHFLVYV